MNLETIKNQFKKLKMFSSPDEIDEILLKIKKPLI